MPDPSRRDTRGARFGRAALAGTEAGIGERRKKEMTWADFYLFCFLFGFFFSVVSVVTGHLGLQTHDGTGAGDFQFGDGGDASGHHITGHHGAPSSVSPFNIGTVAAFLAWFGGAGYLSTRFYGLFFLTALG